MYDGTAHFFSENIKTIEFANGRITNMPLSPKTYQFKKWTIHIDRAYVSRDSIQEDIDNNINRSVFIGPEKLFSYSDSKPVTINYPENFSAEIDIQTFETYRFYYVIAIAILGAAGVFLYKFIIGLLYVFLVITPVILFKFRRQGLSFSGGCRTGLYLASFQLIISTLLWLADIQIKWDFFMYILFYIIYIGAFVNIDLAEDSYKPEMRTKIS